jgi:hypothetical protein
MMNLCSEDGQFDDASDCNGDDDTPEMTYTPKITTPTSPLNTITNDVVPELELEFPTLQMSATMPYPREDTQVDQHHDPHQHLTASSSRSPTHVLERTKQEKQKNYNPFLNPASCTIHFAIIKILWNPRQYFPKGKGQPSSNKGTGSSTNPA